MITTLVGPDGSLSYDVVTRRIVGDVFPPFDIPCPDCDTPAGFVCPRSHAVLGFPYCLARLAPGDLRLPRRSAETHHEAWDIVLSRFFLERDFSMAPSFSIPSVSDFTHAAGDLLGLLNNDLVEVTADIHLRAVMNLPAFLGGARELVELRLTGFTDDNNNLLPEFKVSLEIFDREVLNPEEKIELDHSIVIKAVAGGASAVAAVFEMVFNALAAKGVALPPKKAAK